MNNWHKVTEKLPEHHNCVLAVTKRNTIAVVIFMENKKMMDDLRKKGMVIPLREDEGYSFCSQEIKGNVFNDVIHWQELPLPPEVSM